MTTMTTPTPTPPPIHLPIPDGCPGDADSCPDDCHYRRAMARRPSLSLPAVVGRGIGEPRPCQGCTGHVIIKDAAPDLLPGFPDPLPIPEAAVVPPGWAAQGDVIAKHVRALRWLAAAEIPGPAVASGDGIVICGGGRYWPMIVVAVRMVRDVCQLPVQVWHRGDVVEPIDPADLADIPGVTYHDATKLPHRKLGGWEIKGLALLHCGFERALYFDADAYPVVDPAPLLALATPERPFVFWQDLPWRDHDVRWPAFGIDAATPAGQTPGVQGGQLSIHRAAFWRELVIFAWLNAHSDYSYAHGYGDQSMWSVALATTGRGYHCLGRAPWVGPAFVCAIDGGPPAVVHRTQAKLWGRTDDVKADHLSGESRAWAHRERYIVGPAGGDAATVFTRIYRLGVWGYGTASGGGSTPAEASPYLEIVNGLARVAGWQRVVDLACGDGAITRRLAPVGRPEVVGVDVFDLHLARLRRIAPGIEWVTLDIDRDREQLPPGDVALLKDTLHHWPAALIRDWLAWARGCGRWRWLVVTYDVANAVAGADCVLGGYRPLRADLAPLADIADLRRLMAYLHKEVAVVDCRPS